MFNKLRIHTKLIAGFLTVWLVPLIILLILTNRAKSLSIRQTFDHLKDVNESERAMIEKHFMDRSKEVDILTNLLETQFQEEVSKIVAIREIKNKLIETFFNSLVKNTSSFAGSSDVVNAMRYFKQSFSNLSENRKITKKKAETMRKSLKKYYELNTHDIGTKTDIKRSVNIDEYLNSLKENSLLLQSYFLAKKEGMSKRVTEYNKAHSKYHPIMNAYLKRFGYSDILLVDPDSGDIVYSVSKKFNFAASLKDRSYSKSNLGKAFEMTKYAKEPDYTIHTDYEFSHPTNEPVISTAVPIFDKGKKTGVIIFQVSAAKINSMVNDRTGLDKTGEAYLLGKQDKIISYRSDRVIKKGGILEQKSGKGIVDALSGISDTVLKVGSTGLIEVMTFAPLNIKGLNWAIIISKGLEETLSPHVGTTGKSIFAEFIESRGYEDLLIIKDDGNIFYSVKKAADYRTNIINGKYMNSTLGNLVRKTVETGTGGIVDLSPYEPVNYEPSAFMVRPIKNNGEITFMLVLRMSILEISSIIYPKQGIKKKITSYVVGPDYFLRSDPKLDYINFTLKDSFIKKKKIESISVDSALRGKSGHSAINYELADGKSYNVLSYYTPITPGSGITWALVSEISNSDAFILSRYFKFIVAFAILVGIIMIFVITKIISKNLILPINRTIVFATDIASGDYDNPFNLTGAYEIDLLGSSMDRMRIFLKESRSKIKESELRLINIFNSSTTAMISMNESGIITSVNKTALKIFKYLESELLGENVSVLMPNPYKNQHDTYIKDYLRTGVAHIIGHPRELTAIRKGGGKFLMKLEVFEVKVPGSRTFTATINDLTSLKKAREEEKRAIETLKDEKIKLVEQDWLKTTFAKIISRLQGIKDLRNLSEAFITELAATVGAKAGVFYIKEDDASGPILRLMGSYAFLRRKNISNMFRFGQGLVGECAFEKKEIMLTNVPDDYVIVSSAVGNAKPKAIIVEPVIFEENLVAVFELCTFTDLTPIQLALVRNLSSNLGLFINNITSNALTETLLFKTKELALTEQLQSEELKLANQELELKNKELESADIEIKLKVTQLEKANRYKSEFFANMSHELKTPLNSILMLAGMLIDNEEGNLAKDQIESLKIISKSGTDLLLQINSVLDLSKAEAGKMDIVLDKYKINTIVSYIKTNFNHFAGKKGLTLNVKVDESLPEIIITDGRKVEQIINNLLSNAFKFTVEGSINVNISRPKSNIKALTKESSVAISVIDTGIGIPVIKHTEIFEAFKQADSSTSRRFGGTGLGLSISKKVAEILGGDITLSSTKGMGSTFTLILPEISRVLPDAENIRYVENDIFNKSVEVKNLSEDDKDLSKDIKKLLVTGLKGLDTESVLKGKTILIADNDMRFSFSMSHILKNKGMNVVIAENGKYVLSQLNSNKTIDIVLIGTDMPVMDGLLTISEMKKQDRLKNIPVIVLAAKVINGEDNKYTLAGANDYIAKPVDITKLISKLMVLLGK